MRKVVLASAAATALILAESMKAEVGDPIPSDEDLSPKESRQVRRARERQERKSYQSKWQRRDF